MGQCDLTSIASEQFTHDENATQASSHGHVNEEIPGDIIATDFEIIKCGSDEQLNDNSKLSDFVATYKAVDSEEKIGQINKFNDIFQKEKEASSNDQLDFQGKQLEVKTKNV